MLIGQGCSRRTADLSSACLHRTDALQQANAATPVKESDLVKERAHQQHAAAVGPIQCLVGGRVWDLAVIEAAAFVTNFDFRPTSFQAVTHGDKLGGVTLISVINGIGQGFREPQDDSKGGLAIESLPLHILHEAIGQQLHGP